MTTMSFENTPIAHSPLGMDEATRSEKIHTVIFAEAVKGSRAVALEIAELIKEKA